ncbi:hypothetical protein JZ751_022388 [Albula glossodonta]|uniref:Protein FAM107B n=1 Tax=Albula glossodonta TaxID=121402 RepID=A0A8T2MST7_9TELE|nr:hypothetical protein JZ751_022388 [Albula glossodonta]
MATMLRYPVFPFLQERYQEGVGEAEGLSRGRGIMAEPDYIDADCEDLIQPKKLINPVKSSRNHQDLHRELLMNQKRGLSPQNKPELQKVMEKRKRDQLELEQQKCEEEQENTPEFVKMKGNLRRTKQEAEPQETLP